MDFARHAEQCSLISLAKMPVHLYIKLLGLRPNDHIRAERLEGCQATSCGTCCSATTTRQSCGSRACGKSSSGSGSMTPGQLGPNLPSRTGRLSGALKTYY